jgi:3',5'-cyclic AMP phosphodiesterase CpdA
MKKIIAVALVFLSCWNYVFSQTTTARRDAGRYGIRPVLIRGPYLQVATSNSMIIRWRTDRLDVSFVRYGTEPGKLDKIAGNDYRTQEHVVTVSGLMPQTKYYYLIEGFRDTLQGNADNYFTTLPVAGAAGKYKIGVYGDCGSISTNQRNTRDQFEKYLEKDILNAWILLGDNAYSFGRDIEYQAHFFNIYKDNLLKKSPLFPAPGNHDYQDEPYAAEVAQRSGEIAYYQVFSMPTKGESGGLASHTSAFYSFDIGNIHFLSLDSHGSQENGKRLFDTTGAEVVWVKQDLEANKNKDWIIAYWHHPPYSMGSHNSDRESQMIKIRENFLPILERYGVDLVLCGHSHSYERSKLMQGHYGLETSFNAATHLLSNSSGFYDGSANSCPYIKDASGKGTVYVVSGSSSRVDHKQATFPHDALPFSNIDNVGACILEVEGNRLDLKWVCEDGEIRDRFTMMKNVNKNQVIQIKKGERVTLNASYVGKYKWTGVNATEQSVTVKPSKKVSVYTVTDPYSCLQDVFEVHVN